MSIADLPLFSVHSEPKPKRKHRRTGPVTYKEKSPTYCAKLRAHMASGEWFAYWDLVKVGGARFPARLWEVSGGLDGGNAIPYEVRHDPEDTTKTEYRLLVDRVRR